MKRRKNEGFTLVELLVSIAVLSIVTMGIAGLLRLAAEQYSNATKETEVQNMLQQTFAALSNSLEDAALGVHYDGTKKELTIVNNDKYIKFLLKGDILYYDEKEYDYAADDEEKNEEARAATTGTAQENVLADHVTSFFVDTSSADQGLVVLSVDIRFQERSKNLIQNVFLRNIGDKNGSFLATNTGGIPTPGAGGGGGGGTNPTTAPTGAPGEPVVTTAPTTAPTEAPTTAPTTPPAVNPPTPGATGPKAPDSFNLAENSGWKYGDGYNVYQCTFGNSASNSTFTQAVLTFDNPVSTLVSGNSSWSGGTITLSPDRKTLTLNYNSPMTSDSGFQLTFVGAPGNVNVILK